MRLIILIGLLALILSGCATVRKNHCPDAVIRYGNGNLGYVNTSG